MEESASSGRFTTLQSEVTAGSDTAPKIKDACSSEEKNDQLDSMI